jgi:hypothetical protein
MQLQPNYLGMIGQAMQQKQQANVLGNVMSILSVVDEINNPNAQKKPGLLATIIKAILGSKTGAPEGV